MEVNITEAPRIAAWIVADPSLIVMESVLLRLQLQHRQLLESQVIAAVVVIVNVTRNPLGDLGQKIADLRSHLILEVEVVLPRNAA